MFFHLFIHLFNIQQVFAWVSMCWRQGYKDESNWSLTSLNACFGSFFPTPHSEFHDLVFCIFHCDVAKFNSNLELCISDKFLPWDSLDVISVFFRLSVRLQNHGV